MSWRFVIQKIESKLKRASQKMLGAAMLGANDGAVTGGPLQVISTAKTSRNTGILREPVMAEMVKVSPDLSRAKTSTMEGSQYAIQAIRTIHE